MDNLKLWQPSKKYFKNISPFSMIIIAGRKSGKSYMIKYLYMEYLKSLYDITLVFTLSSKTKEYYEEFILINGEESTCFLEELPEDILQNIDVIQSQHEKPLRILIICDDMAGTDTKLNKGVINCFTRGRHSNVSIIFVTQSPTLASNHIRQNCDVLAILNIRSYDARTFVSNNFISDYTETKEDSMKLLAKLHNYNSLVVDYLCNDIYNYKAPNKYVHK